MNQMRNRDANGSNGTPSSGHPTQFAQKSQDVPTDTTLTVSDEDAARGIEALEEVIGATKMLQRMNTNQIEQAGDLLREWTAGPASEMSPSGIAEVATKLSKQQGKQMVYDSFLSRVEVGEQSTKDALIALAPMVTRGISHSSNAADRATFNARQEGVLDAYAELAKMVSDQDRKTKGY